jgi:pectin methylesterase-like acyl-CoA thioesterase
MKKLQIAIATALCIGLFGCQSGVNDQLIVSGVSIGTSTGLSFVKDSATRTVIANYLQAYAPGLRTITSNPTAADLARLIDAYTPANIKQDYPQVVAFATPLITNAVLTALAHYGHDQATVIKVVNDVASGLEIGSAN